MSTGAGRGPLGRVAASLLSRRVLGGPFRGMRFVPETPGGKLFPKVLGTYEREIWPEVERLLCGTRPVWVVNVGAAEGYYAVGVLFRGLADRVVAFEADEASRAELGRLAARNGVVDRLEVRGYCDRAELRSALRRAPGRVVVLADIEGGERELIDPEAVPELRDADLIVEVHPWAHEGLEQVLLGRFESSHEATRLEARTASPHEIEYPPLRWLARSSKRVADRFLTERSAATLWLAMRRRRQPAGLP